MSKSSKKVTFHILTYAPREEIDPSLSVIILFLFFYFCVIGLSFSSYFNSYLPLLFLLSLLESVSFSYFSISYLEVCFPELFLNKTRQDETGNHFPNWRDQDKTTSSWSHCSGNPGKNREINGTGRDNSVPLGKSLE